MRVATLLGLTAMLAAPTMAMAQTSGTTSGPAAGSAATMGTSGQTTATKHMAESLKNPGSSLKAEKAGGNAGTMPQKGVSDAGAGTHAAPK